MRAKKIRAKGLHADRVESNPREKHFVLAWEKQERANTLSWLLGDGRDPQKPTEREAVVIATFVQWLGSTVGSQWLADVIKTQPGLDGER